MRFISKLFDRFILYFFYIGVVSGAIMASLILISSLLRYVINKPISFSDELSGLLFVTLAFLSFPYVLLKSEHIRLSVFTEKLSDRNKIVCRLFSVVVFFSFSVIFIFQSWEFMSFSKLIQARTDVSGIILWPWMLLMPISIFLCVLVELRNIFRIVSGSIKKEEVL